DSEIRKHFDSAFGERNGVAVTRAAIAFDVNRRFHVEDHSGGEQIRRFRMQARKGVSVNRGEADAVAGGVLEFLSKSVVAENLSCSTVNIGSAHAGPKRLYCGSASFGNRRQYRALPRVRASRNTRARDVRPVA